MTCIVAVSDGKDVWMGGDRRISFGDDSIRDISTPKIWKHGEFVLGTSGNRKLYQILKHYFHPQKIGSKSISEYIYHVFIHDLKHVLEQESYIGGSDDINIHGAVLVGIRGHIVYIGCDLSVIIYDNYEAIGSGCPYALGSLYTSSQLSLSCHTMVKDALRATSSFCSEVSSDFDILTTKEDKE